MTSAVKDISKVDTKEVAGEETRAETWSRSDVIVKEKFVEVYADMPGVDIKGVEVTLHHNVLLAKGRRTDYDGCNKRDYKCSFTLGENVRRDGIKATVKNGVLKVSVPMAKDKGVVSIPIK